MTILEKMLTEASQKYYTTGDSPMTDAEFDEKMAQLKEENPDSPILTSVGHGYDVTQDTTGQKFQHKYFAGSLTKCHNWKEYPSEFKTDPYENVGLSVKLDGLSVVMYYEQGKLVQALTRGDGQTGIDITSKVAKIEPTYTLLKDNTFTGAIRGEIIMTGKQFEEFKKIHPEANNSRNSATGLINGKYIPDSDLAFLNIIVYSVIGAEFEWKLTYRQTMQWIESQFEGHVVPWIMTPVHESTFEEEMKEFIDDHVKDFPCDGVVITLAAKQINNEIKYTAVAFKFPAESAVTTVINIDWNLSKTKFLVPRIQVKPVFLSGATIQWATGFNAQFIKDSGIGSGAEVKIMRSGEVIPYIYEVNVPANVDIPTTCPSCGATLEWSGVHLVCPNRECGDAKIQDMLVWVNKVGTCDNLGDTLILKFMDGLHESISIDSIYAHGSIHEVSESGVQYNNFVRMYNSLFTNKVAIADALQALNIPRLGEVTAQKLAQHRDLIHMLYTEATTNFLQGLSSEDVLKVKAAIGEANGESIAKHLIKFRNLHYIWNNIIWEEDNAVNLRQVAITGKLSVKRADFEKELKANGFITSDNVSKDTFALITDDPNSSSSKNAKALKLGVPKLTESEFREKYFGN